MKSNGKEMNFPDAIKIIKEGGRVKRTEWQNSEWIALRNGQLCIMKEDGMLHPLIVSDGDIYGEDWVTMTD